MKRYLLIALSCSGLAAVAQTHKISGPRTVYNIDANGSHFTFFNLVTGKTCLLSDSATSNWHVAFRKTEILVNGGSSGPGDLAAQVLSGKTFERVLDAPLTGYVNDAGTAKAIPTGSGNGWYNYKTATNTIEVIPGRVIVLHSASGAYAKLEILSYYKDAPLTAGGTSCFYSIRWLVSPNTRINQAITRISNLYAGKAASTFFELPSGNEVATTDSGTTNWDMAFKSTNITMNSGNGGPDNDQAQIAEQDFSTMLIAPTANYRTGTTAIPGGTGNGWYNYDIIVHSIKPIPGRSILVQDAKGRYGKIRILSYYKDNPPNPNFLDQTISRYYTFDYYYQPNGTADLDTLGEDIITTGISKISSENIFKLSPNPVNAGADLKLMLPDLKGNISVSILNNLGTEVKRVDVFATGKEQISLDTKALPAGLYFVKVEQSSTNSIQKLIIR